MKRTCQVSIEESMHDKCKGTVDVLTIDYQLPIEHLVMPSYSSDEQACIKLDCGTNKYHGDNKSILIFSSPKEALGMPKIL